MLAYQCTSPTAHTLQRLRRPNGFYELPGSDEAGSRAPWWRRPLHCLWAGAGARGAAAGACGGHGAGPAVELELWRGEEVSEARQTFAGWATLTTRWGLPCAAADAGAAGHQEMASCWSATAVESCGERPHAPVTRRALRCARAAGCTGARRTRSWSGRWGRSPSRTGWAARWCCGCATRVLR